ncbi:MAG: lytic murein transglycosylase B [Burkholderiaceae bacterium]
MTSARRRFCGSAALALALPLARPLAFGLAAIASPGAAVAAKRKPKKPVASKPSVEPIDYSQRADVLDYIDELVAREGFARDALIRLFADAHYSATAARLMMPATVNVRRDWNVYRARFVEPVRLGSGFRFWDDNAALLERAERDYGVPPEIVVGILGVETVYGRNTGSFRVIDALTTLAFDYPNKARDRSAFFREQLTDALVLTRNDASDMKGGTSAAAALRGSYAGAIGMPQFMPGSILRFAVDYDGDGRIDLVGSTADIIGSVANFLAQHGWVRDLVTHVPLVHAQPFDPLQAVSIEAMVSAGSVPSYAYADLVAAGFAAASSGGGTGRATPPGAPLALIDLPSGSDASGNAIVGYLAGTQNFHVITRYNRSYFYAFSVIELGGTIKALRMARR